MGWMLKNSAGVKDAMLTFAVGGFLITGLTVVLSLVSKISVGETDLILRTPDTTLIAAFLGATLVAYVTRRNVKDKHKHEIEILRAKDTF